jgi:hypothetical protein
LILHVQKLGHPDAISLDVVMPLAKHGGDRRSKEVRADQVDSINLKTQGGTSVTYVLARPKRDRPDLAERVAVRQQFRRNHSTTYGVVFLRGGAWLTACARCARSPGAA